MHEYNLIVKGSQNYVTKKTKKTATLFTDLACYVALMNPEPKNADVKSLIHNILMSHDALSVQLMPTKQTISDYG